MLAFSLAAWGLARHGGAWREESRAGVFVSGVGFSSTWWGRFGSNEGGRALIMEQQGGCLINSRGEIKGGNSFISLSRASPAHSALP